MTVNVFTNAPSPETGANSDEIVLIPDLGHVVSVVSGADFSVGDL